jgi:DNA polymerase iota
MSVIVHIDYDSFYAAVFESQTPSLRSLPLAVRQKQIIVTCNYVARARGLYKLQLLADAQRMCPDLVVVAGENLDAFRDASAALWRRLRAASWAGGVERLGLDEVFLDVSDIVDWNLRALGHDPSRAFFRTGDGQGFAFDATKLAGHGFEEPDPGRHDEHRQEHRQEHRHESEAERLRLVLGSHLAAWLRADLEQNLGYSATAGVATNKLLAKMVGSLNKPRSQTTLLPSRSTRGPTAMAASIHALLDPLDIGALPGIGHATAAKLRSHLRSLPSTAGLERVTVAHVRACSSLTASALERLLAGPGAARGIGRRVHGLVRGLDATPVRAARDLPTQISIEDSFGGLDEADVPRTLRRLCAALLRRVHKDLCAPEGWLAMPSTLRLSVRARGGARTSRSTSLPAWVLRRPLHAVEDVAARLVGETLMPLYARLRSRPTPLTLLNICVAGLQRRGGGDIGRMFRVELGESEHVDDGREHEREHEHEPDQPESDQHEPNDQNGEHDEHDDGDDRLEPWECECECGALLPRFAMAAHARFHRLGE